jgi:hypothetical protein
VNYLTAQNVLQSVSNPIVLPIARPPSQNVSQFAKNPNVTGNVLNQSAQNPSVSWSARTQPVFLRSNAVIVVWVHSPSNTLSHSSKKLKQTKAAVGVGQMETLHQQLEISPKLLQITQLCSECHQAQILSIKEMIFIKSITALQYKCLENQNPLEILNMPTSPKENMSIYIV